MMEEPAGQEALEQREPAEPRICGRLVGGHKAAAAAAAAAQTPRGRSLPVLTQQEAQANGAG